MHRIVYLLLALFAIWNHGLDAAILVDMPNPPVSGGGTVYFNRDGALWLNCNFGNKSANIITIDLDKQLTAGKYYVYLQVDGVTEKDPLEMALGNDLQLLELRNTGQKLLGPAIFDARESFSTLAIRSQVPARIKRIVVTDSRETGANYLTPEKLSRQHAFWLKNPESFAYPYWISAGDKLNMPYLSHGSGKAELNLRIYDYDHQVVFERRDKIEFGKNGHLELPELKKYGSYIIRCQISSDDGQEIDLQKIVAAVSSETIPPSKKLGGHGNSVLLLAMGAGRERLWDSNRTLLWNRVEPEKGKRDWSGSMLPPEPLNSIAVIDTTPKWALPTHEDPAERLDFVDELTRRYRGKVEIYEIFNEPYQVMTKYSAERHIEVVGKIAEVIRKNDPETKVATGGPPEEIPPALEWWEKMAEGGLFKHVDVVTGHFYVGGGGTHPLDQDLRFDAYIRAVKKVLAKNGAGDKELIDSESGLCPNESFYLGAPAMVYGSWGGRGFTPRMEVPYRIGTPMFARLLVLHLFHEIPWLIYHTRHASGNSWSLCDNDLTPLPGAVAMAQIFKVLHDAKPDKRLVLPENYFGVSFQKGEECIGAFWAVHLQSGESRFFSGDPSSRVELFDLFMNPLARKQEMPIGVNPVYVRGSRVEVEKFFKSLKSRSEIDQSIAASGRFDKVVTVPGYQGFKVVAPEAADGYDISAIYDGNTVSSDESGSSFMAKEETEPVVIVYEWDQPQSINWITVGWTLGHRPEKYRVEWHDGVRWILTQGTPGWRKPPKDVEVFPIREIKTTRLRLSYVSKDDSPARIVEFSALHAPRITPPITEMQEIYNEDFKPDAQGWVKDWLVCGPFPSTGTRYGKGKPVNWDTNFLRNHSHYGQKTHDGNIRPKVDEQHHVNFPENLHSNWRIGRATVNWQPWHSKDGEIDFAAIFRESGVYEKPQIVEHCYGYAVCYITLEDDFKGVLAIGSDDGYKVMIDDQLIAEKIIFRGAKPDQEKYPVEIKAGEHRILMRVHNDIGGHSFWFRLLTQDGKPFTAFTVKLVE